MNLAKTNCTENRVCTSGDIVVLGRPLQQKLGALTDGGAGWRMLNDCSTWGGLEGLVLLSMLPYSAKEITSLECEILKTIYILYIYIYKQLFQLKVIYLRNILKITHTHIYI